MASFPLIRDVHRGMTGPDCFAIKRALKAHKLGRGLVLRGPGRRRFGRWAVYNLKRFQKQHGLRVDGIYGPSTHRKMTFDAFGKQLMGQAPKPNPLGDKRSRIVKAAVYASSKRGYIHYTQSSLRMEGVRRRIKPPAVPSWEDCSSFCTWLYWLVGGPDPNGLGFPGYGYTGTMINHGRRISMSSVKPGDLVFYGGWSRWSAPTHVAVYIGGGKVVSHGNEAGPQVLNVYYRSINRVISYI